MRLRILARYYSRQELAVAYKAKIETIDRIIAEGGTTTRRRWTFKGDYAP